MDKFQNKYRIPSARLQTWDYGRNRSYFITICTQNRRHFFGEILYSTNHDESIMYLNDMGKMAEKYWVEIPQHFPFVSLGNFVIMPNHMYGILIIDNPAVVQTRLIASLAELQSPTPESPLENNSTPTDKKNREYETSNDSNAPTHKGKQLIDATVCP